MRTGSCAHGTFQVRELASYGDFEKRKLTHVLITSDELDEAVELEASYELPFPLLTDPAMGVHEAFGVVAEAEGDDGKTEKSGISSLFLFKAEGELVWQHAEKDITVRPRIEQLLHVLDAQGFKPTA